jgi:hypothetical protein
VQLRNRKRENASRSRKSALEQLEIEEKETLRRLANIPECCLKERKEKRFVNQSESLVPKRKRKKSLKKKAQIIFGET